MAALIESAKVHLPRSVRRFGLLRSTVLVVRIASLIVCFHMLQILLWAWFYRRNCFPTWEAAIYFSATSYSTVDASDLVLPRHWRTVGPVDSVPAVLMCGLSASSLFAVVTRLVARQPGGTGEALKNSTSALPQPGPLEQNNLDSGKVKKLP
jgi:voltage-gated potassium channel